MFSRVPSELNGSQFIFACEHRVLHQSCLEQIDIDMIVLVLTSSARIPLMPLQCNLMSQLRPSNWYPCISQCGDRLLGCLSTRITRLLDCADLSSCSSSSASVMRPDLPRDPFLPFLASPAATEPRRKTRKAKCESSEHELH